MAFFNISHQPVVALLVFFFQMVSYRLPYLQIWICIYTCLTCHMLPDLCHIIIIIGTWRHSFRYFSIIYYSSLLSSPSLPAHLLHLPLFTVWYTYNVLFWLSLESMRALIEVSYWCLLRFLVCRIFPIFSATLTKNHRTQR